jgi:dTDP-4-dehydrorhamnose reductase
VLVTGAGGQLGRALATSVPAGIELRAVDRAALDIADAAAVGAVFEAFRPEVVLNAAAYTAVDRAESDAEGARRGNVTGPRCLAEAAARSGARLLHVSTDFVFDGRQSWPYAPSDTPGPLGAYGRSKLEGETAVLDVLGEDATIVRTAWVYAASVCSVPA